MVAGEGVEGQPGIFVAEPDVLKILEGNDGILYQLLGPPVIELGIFIIGLGFPVPNLHVVFRQASALEGKELFPGPHR